jgi:thiamine kinase-like enzyme
MPVTAQQIIAIFDVEVAANKKARTLHDVPGAYEALTTEWLTAVLCAGTPDAEVSEFRIADRSDGSSNRARIHLVYNAAGLKAGLPATVFCKGAMSQKNRVLQGLCTGAHGETMFFLKARDRLGIETPQHIHAAYDPQSYAYIIVMKDIGATTHFCNEKTTITRAHAEKIVNTLAKMHARFYESPELGTAALPFKTWPKFWGGTLNSFPGFAEACDTAFGMAKDVIPPRLFARRTEVWPATLASVERHDHLPKMLVHCDVHLGNWYIAINGDMGLTDWQAVSIGHWSRDFAYALSTTLNVEDRRAWFTDLLRLYLDKLVAHGAPRVSYDDALFNVRQQLMTALAYWTITLVPAPGMPPMQPPGITIELVRRTATAIDDMNALDAF